MQWIAMGHLIAIGYLTLRQTGVYTRMHKKNLSTLNTLKAPKKCDIVTLWQEFSIKQRSIGSNFCRLSSIVAKTDRNFCKNTIFIYISSNSSMQWKNLANKRNSPGSRADDIRWVRPWRICGAWRTSGVHQVKSATNLDCNKYPTLTPDKSAMPVSTNPPLPPSESSTSKYFLKDFRKIWTKVSRFAYLWLCVFLRLSELPNFGSLKIFQQPIPCKTYQGKQNIMWWGIFNIYLNLNVIRSYLA